MKSIIIIDTWDRYVDGFTYLQKYIESSICKIAQFLNKVDIPGHVKLKVQEAVHRKIPQLIKHRFQVMFLKDKLSTQIKNLDSWIMEFTRLSRFRGLNDK